MGDFRAPTHLKHRLAIEPPIDPPPPPPRDGASTPTFLRSSYLFNSCLVALPFVHAIVDSSFFFEVGACALRLCAPLPDTPGSRLDTPALVPIFLQAEIAMKHVAALLLAQLGGNATPSAEVRRQSR